MDILANKSKRSKFTDERLDGNLQDEIFHWQILRRKLIESGLYTDQIYPGSDTRILIDLFAWTFDVLTYILNNNLSNAIFEDTEIYENLNKIVKVRITNAGYPVNEGIVI